MVFNPWHDVDSSTPSSDNVRAIIEISQGSRAKYELDKESGLLKLDRVLYSSVYYPANYGFIPRTLGDDHDPLDILVLSQVSIEPLCIVRARVLGVMRMVDSGEGDDKLIAVAADDVSVSHIETIADLPRHFSLELRQFFEEYKKLENKTVLVEDFMPLETALQILDRARSLYTETFGPK
jgi:inorganic pyrophosphatase